MSAHPTTGIAERTNMESCPRCRKRTLNLITRVCLPCADTKDFDTTRRARVLEAAASALIYHKTRRVLTQSKGRL